MLTKRKWDRVNLCTPIFWNRNTRQKDTFGSICQTKEIQIIFWREEIVIKPSITIIIPAYNEEEGLAATVETVVKAIGHKFHDYELLIFNDNSQDKTGEIADHLAKQNSHIRVVHNPQNMGLGYNYRTGVDLASNEYIGWVSADNVMSQDTLETIFDSVGQADIVLVYLHDARALSRRIISRIYITLLNLLFGLKVKYYNGGCIHKSELIKPLKMSTNSFAFMAEILIRLIKSGHTYVEVGMHAKEREKGESKAFTLKNFLQVNKVIFRLYWEIQILEIFKKDTTIKANQLLPNNSLIKD